MAVNSPKSAQRGLSPQALELVAARYRVLGETNRLKLIQALGHGESSVGELTDLAGLTQANASRHLQTLTESGVLKRRKEGLRVLYSIADRDIFKLCEHVCGSLEQRFKARSKALSTS
jgi:ArsR family transcriptional regulator